MAEQDEKGIIAQDSKMAQLLADTRLAPRVFSRGETVEGEIVAILHDCFLIGVGAKAEGIIPKKELEEAGKEYKVGDKISAIVAQPEGDSGTTILTVKKAPRDKAWEDLQMAAEADKILQVRGIDSNRGGLIVEINGLRGFVPSSHLITSTKEAIGKPLSVKVIEIAKDVNKLVFSEKEAAGDSLPKIELPFKVEDVLGVKITKILPFGLLVSLPGGTEGLIHISEISWRKVGPLADLYKTGQELKSKVISIDPNSGKVNLSIKQLEEDPWQKAAKKYPVGSVFDRKVSKLASYGVFVGLEDGIEGLLHSSKIPYGRELKEGDSLKVSIDLFNTEQRRVALRLAPDQELENNKEKEKSKGIKATKEKKPARNATPARSGAASSGEHSVAGGETKEKKETKGKKVESKK